MVNASGAGDSFLAAAIYAFLKGLSPEEGIDLAMAAGALTTRCEETVSPELSVEALGRVLREKQGR